MAAQPLTPRAQEALRLPRGSILPCILSRPSVLVRKYVRILPCLLVLVGVSRLLIKKLAELVDTGVRPSSLGQRLDPWDQRLVVGVGDSGPRL